MQGFDGRSQTTARRTRLRRRTGQATSIAGLVLFSSFFMPAVDGCATTPVAPFEFAVDMWSRLPSPNGLEDLARWAWVTIVATVPYFFGLFIGVVYMIQSQHLKQDKYFIVDATTVVGFATVSLFFLVLAAGRLADLGRIPMMSISQLLLFCLAVLSPIYCLISRSNRRSWSFCLHWYTALSISCWLANVAFSNTTHYGLWVSLIGSAALLAGLTAKAHAHSSQTTCRTIGLLLRGRVDIHDANTCSSCDYSLVGLTCQRCPECGQSLPSGA